MDRFWRHKKRQGKNYGASTQKALCCAAKNDKIPHRCDSDLAMSGWKSGVDILLSLMRRLKAAEQIKREPGGNKVGATPTPYRDTEKIKSRGLQAEYWCVLLRSD